jgi:hypothetical protein
VVEQGLLAVVERQEAAQQAVAELLQAVRELAAAAQLAQEARAPGSVVAD